MKPLYKTFLIIVLVFLFLLFLRFVIRSAVSRRVEQRNNFLQNIFDRFGKNQQSENEGVNGVNVPENVPTVDCADGSCQEIAVNGDPKYAFPNGTASPFSGYADPSIRRDPHTDMLWMAYSWPHFKIEGTTRSPSSEIHLAKSDDDGQSWTFVKKLWETTALSNPAKTTQSGYLDYEVVNLLPVDMNGATTWFAVTLNYFVPSDGGFAARPSNSFHIRVSKSSTVEGLSNAPAQVLGGGMTATQWNVNQTLVPSDIGAFDKKSFFWNEPSLYYENGTLYLTMVAFNVRNRSDITRDGVYVFGTKPDGDPSTWNWSYKGKLAGSNEASELGGQRLTQVDIARGVNGQLLMITSPDDWSSTFSDYNHKGCVALEVASMEQPALARDENGQLVVHARVTDSTANALGSAACSYDPSNSGGILFTRRNKTQTELTAGIWKTFLNP
ncbi:exo-alpha-sialidase [Candidatus Woesebacteria bacterium]|nr:exo-alpha-sialidase [Candidatus Woesebacteria bacterium]